MQRVPVPQPRTRTKKFSSSVDSEADVSPKDNLEESSLSLELLDFDDELSQDDGHSEMPPKLPPKLQKKQLSYQHSKSISPSDDDLESYREFARHNLFTDEEFDSAIKSITGNLDTNSLLAQLIAVRSSGQYLGVSSLKPSLIENTSYNKIHPKLRSIVIDGSNVAMAHGCGCRFSCLGIQIAVDWFKQRGHENIKVFVPAYRLKKSRHVHDSFILAQLKNEGVLVQTPSRRLHDGRSITCYDDRFMIKYASEEKSIVVSNDQFRDLVNESAAFLETISERLLVYTFAGDMFMPAEDPLGRLGQSLDLFLCEVTYKPLAHAVCPYGRKCTYGTKCKYSHPERQSTAIDDHYKVLYKFREKVAASTPKQVTLPQVTYYSPQPQNHRSLVSYHCLPSSGHIGHAGFHHMALTLSNTSFSYSHGNNATSTSLVNPSYENDYDSGYSSFSSGSMEDGRFSQVGNSYVNAQYSGGYHSPEYRNSDVASCQQRAGSSSQKNYIPSSASCEPTQKGRHNQPQSNT